MCCVVQPVSEYFCVACVVLVTPVGGVNLGSSAELEPDWALSVIVWVESRAILTLLPALSVT